MMIAHVAGLLSNPNREWEAIREEPCSIGRCYVGLVMILAAIPPVCAFIGTTQFGWQIGAGNAIKLTAGSALQIAIAFYVAILVAVYIMGRAIHWMATTYGAAPELSKCVVLAAYAGTPLFLSGAIALYPVLWLNMLVGLAGLGYTIYLLYTGVPIVMEIPKEQGFMFATAVLTVGMVTLVGLLAVTVILWGFGIAPAFTS